MKIIAFERIYLSLLATTMGIASLGSVAAASSSDDYDTASSTTAGGDGGSIFSEKTPTSFIRVRGGGKVDNIVIDGTQYGGTGGTLSDRLYLQDEDDYYNYFEIRGGSRVDYLKICTASGNCVSAGGSGGTKVTRENIRIVGFSGRSGGALDQLTIYWTPLYSNKLKEYTFGQDGGTAFDEEGISTLELAGGGKVDGIALNDNYYGGSGGSDSGSIILGTNDYISSFTIGHNGDDTVIDYLAFTMSSSDDDYTTTIEAGDADCDIEETFKGVRVFTLAGSAGTYLDQLTVKFLEGYEASSTLYSNVPVIIGGSGGGVDYTFYESESVMELNSVYQMSTLELTSEAEAEFYSSVNAAFSTTFTSQQDVYSELQTEVYSSTTVSVSVDKDDAFWEIGHADVLKTADGDFFLIPKNSDPYWTVMDEAGLESFMELTDILIDTASFVNHVTGSGDVVEADDSFDSADFKVYKAKESTFPWN